MSDEAHFHLHGTVIKKNFRYWSAANPHEFHQRPTYDPKVIVWCAVWSRGVKGPYFFEDEEGKAITVTSQRYTEMINEILSPNLPPNNGTLWFQLDGAMAHMAVISIAALRRLFPQRVISRFSDVLWPPRSPDLTAPDFFSVGVIRKVKCTVLALQTYMHSKKTYGKKSPNFQNKHFKPLSAPS